MQKFLNWKLLLVAAVVCSLSTNSVFAVDFFNPVKFDTPEELIVYILENLKRILAVLSIIFIIIGGLLYIVSSGNPTWMTRAKNTILFSLIGFSIAVAAPTFLREIAVVLGWKKTPAEIKDALSFAAIILNVIKFLLGVVGALALILLIIGGAFYIFSGGAQSRADTGKKMITYAIIGIAVSLAALLIVIQVGKFF